MSSILRRSKLKQRRHITPEEWAARYPKDWSSNVSPSCKKATKFICCDCWRLKTVSTLNTHHAKYRVFLVLKPRIWAAGIYLFPLCKECHKKAHSPQNYIKDRYDPVWRNRNTDAYIKYIRRRYIKLQIRLFLVQLKVFLRNL